MSTADEPSTFFPPLSSLLSGSARLLSIQSAHSLLALSPSFAANSESLEKFCYDANTFTLLSTCPDALPKPSAQSKAAFESRTAPIEVSGSQNGDYDLEQMKKDALELSGQLGVEESFALRIVVLEWQSRANEQLLRGGGDDASRAADMSVSVLGKSSMGLNGSVNGPAQPAINFADESTRRRRQLQVYLSERSSRLRLGTDLLSYDASRERPEKDEKTWMDDLASQLFKKRFLTNTDDNAAEQIFQKCMVALDEQLAMLDDTTKLPKMTQESEETLLMYASATFNDIVTILRLLLLVLHARRDLPSSSMVTTWFQKLESMNYFLTLTPSPAWPDTTELHCLISLISLVILDASATISRLRDTLEPHGQGGGISYPRLDSGKYYESEDCARELNLIFYRAALNNISILSPAIFAWAVITTLIRDIARGQTEMRERMLEDLSSDNDMSGRRRSSRRDSRGDMSQFEKVYASLQDVELETETKEDPPAWFAAHSVESVFEVIAQLSTFGRSLYATAFASSTQYLARVHLLRLLRQGLVLTFYGEEVLEAILAVLAPEKPAKSPEEGANSQISARFIQDEAFRQEILEQALTRYPFELSPVLRLLSALTSAQGASYEVMQLLESLRSITMMVPEDFNAYTLENEDENTNEIQILEDLPLFVSRQSRSWFGSHPPSRKALTIGSGEDSERGLNVSLVPAGRLGTVLKESRPMIFKMEHPHSGLEYLGLFLSTRSPSSEMVVAPRHPPLDLITAADIVALTTSLLESHFNYSSGASEAKYVLQRMSDALLEETDIISVLAEIFERELIAHLDQTAQDGSLELLVACADLFALIVKIEPSRTWAILANSSLLGLNGSTNALAAVVGATETATGQFRFLAACVTMYGNLIDDAVAGLVKRRPVEQPTKKGRFDSPIERTEYTPERTMQKVLDAFTAVTLEAWESLAEWRFAVAVEKANIADSMCASFNKLWRATYGLHSETEVVADAAKTAVKLNDHRLSALLFPAASAALDFFAPAISDATNLRSFAKAFAESASVLSTQCTDSTCSSHVCLVQSAAEVLVTLLRTSRLRDGTSKRERDVAMQLLRLVPDLVVIFTAQSVLEGPVAALLSEITASLDNGNGQSNPPSLFTHLATPTAKAFLLVISQLARSSTDPETEQHIWAFLVAVMRGRQQWLALYMLTGAMPKERLDASSTKQSGQSKSLLDFALDQLSASEDLSHKRSELLLQFVVAAQSVSIWASNTVRAHPSFLTHVVDWLDNQKHPEKQGNTAEQLVRANEAKKSALGCEILAQAVHGSVEVGDKSVLKKLAKRLNYLSAQGQAVDAYNRSLHQNLTDNFRSRFSGVQLSAFKRSAANPAGEYGKGWTYDVDLMDQALRHENVWSAGLRGRGRTDGFRDEACRANVNFSLLSAQTTLLKAWSALATTIAECLGSAEDNLRADLSASLAKAVKSCLDANAVANIDIPGTDEVITMRAEMSFVVLSKLSSGPSTQDVRAVLPAAWRALHRSPADFDVATQEEDLHYYRLALQIVFFAIQPHIHSSPSAQAKKDEAKATDETPVSFLDPNIAGVLTDIVRQAVAPAWRALAGNLHTNVACALPGDFALVTAVLQAVLAVPGVSAIHTQIGEVVASMQLVRSALSLYSWADRLADSMDDDPVYGELAVQFMQVLSTVKPVAEHIALEGALTQLASANLSTYFRKPSGKGPFDEPRRMFTIWTEGMLPLCLNLLDAVGPPVAAEVSGFLNGFPAQVERANTALENRDPTKFHPHAGAVTLGLVQEAHSLCLIAMILQSDSARAAAEGIDAMGVGGGLKRYEYKKVVEDGAGLVRQKASLASRITPASAVEHEWAGRMVDGVDSVLSAKIFMEVRGLAGMSEEDGQAGS